MNTGTNGTATRPLKPTATINPDDFSDKAWGELCNCVEALKLIDTDPRCREVGKRQLRTAIDKLATKALLVSDGFYGRSDEDVDIEEWAEDLRDARRVLIGYLETLTSVDPRPIVVPRSLVQTIVDLGALDLYTDAGEYSERVEQLQSAIFQLSERLKGVTK